MMQSSGSGRRSRRQQGKFHLHCQPDTSILLFTTRIVVCYCENSFDGIHLGSKSCKSATELTSPKNELHSFPRKSAHLGYSRRHQVVAGLRKPRSRLNQSNSQSRNPGIEGLRLHRSAELGRDAVHHPPLRPGTSRRSPSARQPRSTSERKERAGRPPRYSLRRRSERSPESPASRTRREKTSPLQSERPERIRRGTGQGPLRPAGS